MSVQAMAWVLEDEQTTRGPDRLVLLSLANHTNDDGQSWIGLARIMREANIAQERTARAALRSLEAAGIISTELQAAPDARIPGNRKPNLYTILALRPAPPLESVGGARGAARGGARRGSGGAPDAPQTIIDPREEPGDAVPPSPRRAVRKRTRVDDEVWNASRRKIAEDAGMTESDDRRHEWRQFRDHHLAAGSTMLDWDAAWRKWCRNWQRWHPAPGTKAAPDPTHEVDGLRFERGVG